MSFLTNMVTLLSLIVSYSLLAIGHSQSLAKS